MTCINSEDACLGRLGRESLVGMPLQSWWRLDEQEVGWWQLATCLLHTAADITAHTDHMPAPECSQRANAANTQLWTLSDSNDGTARVAPTLQQSYICMRELTFDVWLL